MMFDPKDFFTKIYEHPDTRRVGAWGSQIDAAMKAGLITSTYDLGNPIPAKRGFMWVTGAESLEELVEAVVALDLANSVAIL